MVRYCSESLTLRNLWEQGLACKIVPAITPPLSSPAATSLAQGVILPILRGERDWSFPEND